MNLSYFHVPLCHTLKDGDTVPVALVCSTNLAVISRNPPPSHLCNRCEFPHKKVLACCPLPPPPRSLSPSPSSTSLPQAWKPRCRWQYETPPFLIGYHDHASHPLTWSVMSQWGVSVEHPVSLPGWEGARLTRKEVRLIAFKGNVLWCGTKVFLGFIVKWLLL